MKTQVSPIFFVAALVIALAVALFVAFRHSDSGVVGVDYSNGRTPINPNAPKPEPPSPGAPSGAPQPAGGGDEGKAGK